MTYLEEFKTQINSRNFTKFLQLWEEYCTSDHVDIKEFSQLLLLIKNSDFAKNFGKLIETALPLWQTIQNKEDSYYILRLLFDLETTNSPALAELALQTLKEKYGTQPEFQDRLRLIGLRSRDNFQGALSSYDLLNHLKIGNFVFHNGGWGTGEIVEISPIRQQITIEFENVAGRKHVIYENAFKTLTPLKNEHFLARRFAEPDLLEKDTREDPVGIIKLLLQDLGPKTASEIKDELCELVIPENDWTKWWQNTRTKLKKDPMIDSPESPKEPFKLREKEITKEELLHKAINHKTGAEEIILSSYNFLRDLPNLRENDHVRAPIKTKLNEQLSDPSLTTAQEIQILMLLEGHFPQEAKVKTAKELIEKLDNIDHVIEQIDIVALKKRALTLVKEYRKDWVRIFIYLMNAISHSTLRDYILKELNLDPAGKPELKIALENLLHHPEKSPDCFLWYFQQIIDKDHGDLFFSDKEGQCQFFEAFLILLSKIENRPDSRDQVKKMYSLLSGKRYAVVRAIMEGAKIEHHKEFLLLAAKCHTLSDQDRKILQSLAAVVHPSLGDDKTKINRALNEHILWATEEGFLRVQEQLRQIGTVEMIENAREIEAARALGDLRENSEFKFAKERRARLQGQMKTLSEQLQKARIITKDDIVTDEISIGSVVEVESPRGEKLVYTILGPWEADADKNILSFQSKLAQSMIGCRKGDTFQFRDEEFKVNSLKSYLDK